jgi:hypothetical protein
VGLFCCDVSPAGCRPDLGAESVGGQDVAGTLRVDPRRQFGHPRLPLADEVVEGPERVEQVVAVGKEVLATRARDADRVGEHAQREGLGKPGDGIELVLDQHLLDELLGVDQPVLAEFAQCSGAEDLRQNGAGSVVVGRIGFQQQARRAPGLLVAEVADADTGRGLEGLPVGQCGVNLLVTTRRVDVVPVQVDDGACVAQCGVKRRRVFEHMKGIAASRRLNVGDAREASSHIRTPIRTRRSASRCSQPCPTNSSTSRDAVATCKPARRATSDTPSAGVSVLKTSKIRTAFDSTDSPLDALATPDSLRWCAPRPQGRGFPGGWAASGLVPASAPNASPQEDLTRAPQASLVHEARTARWQL